MLVPTLILGIAVAAYAQVTGNQYAPCGVQVVQPKQKRIVGGVVANPGSWPWTVLIVDDADFISGTGAIINPNIILTSAQHFEGETYNVFDLNLHLWRLYAGEYNISKDDPNEQYYRIRRVLLHPGYNATSLENDIALVITDNVIMWNDHTRPACIPDSTHQYTVGDTCYLPGWGSTSSTGNEELLNQLAYPILDDSVCKQHWDDFIPNTEICAGYVNQTKDFCGDDIGSPLMCKALNGAWYIQGVKPLMATARGVKPLMATARGIASSGGDCLKASEPGVFEDVTKYSDWIRKTMEEAGYPYQY